MAVAEFPLPSVDANNPDPLVSYKLQDKFQVGVTRYDDGGVDTALQNGGAGIQRWYLFYDGLFAAGAAILDSHVASAKLPEDEGPSAYTFNFRDPDSAILYTGVRYQSFERPVHKNKDIQTRIVILVRYP
jgi:hypothetical protein